jgi:hypothetical protein
MVCRRPTHSTHSSFGYSVLNKNPRKATTLYDQENLAARRLDRLRKPLPNSDKNFLTLACIPTGASAPVTQVVIAHLRLHLLYLKDNWPRTPELKTRRLRIHEGSREAQGWYEADWSMLRACSYARLVRPRSIPR